MHHISILSSSVRTDRKSHNVALFFQKYLIENNTATTVLLDLKEYNFPLFDERLKNQKKPLETAVDFAENIKKSDAVIIVTPEYNGSFPASLKNVIDLLYEEWHHKPIAIVTVSNGNFAGTQCLVALQFTLWKIGALTVPKPFQVAKVEENYDEKGNAIDKEKTHKLAGNFINELLWIIKINKSE